MCVVDKINKITAQIRHEWDEFGEDCRIDGDYAVVGAPYDGYDADDRNYVADAGAAYVYKFVSGQWTFKQKLVATGTNARQNGDTFGSSVAISGNTIAVGSPVHDYDSNGANLISNAGAVFIFVRNNETWTQQAKLTPVGNNARIANDYLTATLPERSLDIDGDTVVAGSAQHSYDANGDNPINLAGAVWVWTRTGTTWTQQQKLVAPLRVPLEGYFGISCAVEGDTLVIGAQRYGTDATGKYRLEWAGAAFVYTRSGVTWSLNTQLMPQGLNARNEFDMFGTAVAFSGSLIVVGASGPSEAHDYDANGANFVDNAGAAWVFRKVGATWQQQQKLVGVGTNGRNADDFFGYKVATDGYYVAIGSGQHDYDAYGKNYRETAGAVWVFAPGANGFGLIEKLAPDADGERHEYGAFNVVHLNNGRLVVGAPGNEYDVNGDNQLTAAGAAWLFEVWCEGLSSWSSSTQSITSSSTSSSTQSVTTSSISAKSVSTKSSSTQSATTSSSSTQSATTTSQSLSTQSSSTRSATTTSISFTTESTLTESSLSSSTSTQTNTTSSQSLTSPSTRTSSTVTNTTTSLSTRSSSTQSATTTSYLSSTQSATTTSQSSSTQSATTTSSTQSATTTSIQYI